MQVQPLDSVSWPYAFSQRHLLNTSEFIREAERRGCRLDPGQLEAFHRAGLLIPFFQVSLPRVPFSVIDLSGNRELLQLREAGQLSDPRQTGYSPWGRYRRRGPNGSTYSRIYLYSYYQLLAVPGLTKLQVHLRPRPTAIARPRYQLVPLLMPRSELTPPDQIALLTRLEPVYLPNIRRRVTFSALHGEREAWYATFAVFRRDFRPQDVLDELGLKADEVLQRAERLIIDAGFFDPLDDWVPLVRQMDPDRWEDLKGEALAAVDHRVAAEILFSLYEDLADTGAAPALPDLPPRASHPLKERIARVPTALDADLTRFGLSPHPALLVVLEGPSDLLLLRRVMEKLRVRPGRSFIELVHSGGVDVGLETLVAFASSPDLGEVTGEYVLLRRPPTRFLRAIDEEGSMGTSAKRDRQRRHLVSQIETALKFSGGPMVDRQELEKLVEIFSWGQLPMEFANFTDAELASGINGISRSGNPVAAKDLAAIRASAQPGAGLRRILKGPPKIEKTDLAEALWPHLDRRLQNAIDRKELTKVPMARLVLRAAELAAEWPRGSFALKLARSATAAPR